MIYSLRKKLIWICGASITAVFVIIFVLICAFAANQLDSAMDGITDMISENGGTLPDFKEEPPIPAEKEAFPDFFPKESRLNVAFLLYILILTARRPGRIWTLRPLSRRKPRRNTQRKP